MNSAATQNFDDVIGGFLADHKLPESYRDIANRWFLPVLDKVAKQQSEKGSPLVLGINGCQGSGKSTLADLAVTVFKRMHRKTAVAISIDDFYLTLAEREQLAQTVHPLLQTRGVPGTHDMALAQNTLRSLIETEALVQVPRFDKAVDDRAEESEWTSVQAPVDIVIIEGWCVGAVPQAEDALELPVNDLEEFEDRNGDWRRYVNEKLAGVYQAFHQSIDVWLMLKAPSFECVYQWRLEQEEKLKQSLAQMRPGRSDFRVMSPQQIRRFIQYYQRVTEHTLATLPSVAQVVYQLDGQRQIEQMQDRL